MEAKAGHTYRFWIDGKEVEHFHVSRVHGRRISFKVTAWSALYWDTTRLRWKKMQELFTQAGGEVTEEPTNAPGGECE